MFARQIRPVPIYRSQEAQKRGHSSRGEGERFHTGSLLAKDKRRGQGRPIVMRLSGHI